MPASLQNLFDVGERLFHFVFKLLGVSAGLVGPGLPGLTLSGTVTAKFNTGTSAVTVSFNGVDMIVPGIATPPYLRIELANATLGVLGNSVTAESLTFERAAAMVTVGGTGLGLTIAAGGRRVVSITGAGATFTFTAAGLSGSVTGGTVLGPDFAGAFTFAGTVSVAVDTTVASPFVRVSVAMPSLTILGVTVSATTVAMQLVLGTNGAANTVSMAVTGLGVMLGDGGAPLVTLSGLNLSLTISSAGIVASASGGTVNSGAITGATFIGTGGLRLDTTNSSNRYLRVSLGTTLAPATLTIGTHVLSGVFVFEQIQATASRTVVRVAAAGVSMSIGSVLTVTNGSGFLLVSSLGVAGSLGASATITMPTADVEITATSFRIDVNATSSPVSESLMLNGDALELSLPAGPFVQVVVLGASMYVAEEPAITADLFFRTDGANIVFAVRNLAVTIGVNAVGGGEGMFLILPTGIAGVASGSVSVSGGGFNGGASGALRVNTTGLARTETINFGGTPFALNIPAGTGGLFFDLTVTSASLNIGGFVTIEGSFVGDTVSNVRIFLGQGPSQLDGQPNPAARGVLISGAFGRKVEINGGVFFYAQGQISLLGRRHPADLVVFAEKLGSLRRHVQI